MTDLKKYEHRLLKIRKIKSDALLSHITRKFSVFENHRHTVTRVNNKLIVLAVSKDGIEMVKHRSKPIWGTQFHPEKFVKKNIGKKVLTTFLDYKFKSKN